MYIPHTGSFTMLFGASSNFSFALRCFGAPRKLPRKRRRIHRSNNKTTTQNTISIIPKAIEWMPSVDQFFVRAPLAGDSRIGTQKLFPNGNPALHIFFPFDQNDSLVVLCLGKAGSVVQDVVQCFQRPVFLAQIMKAGGEVRFDIRIVRTDAQALLVILGGFSVLAEVIIDICYLRGIVGIFGSRTLIC